MGLRCPGRCVHSSTGFPLRSGAVGWYHRARGVRFRSVFSRAHLWTLVNRSHVRAGSTAFHRPAHRSLRTRPRHRLHKTAAKIAHFHRRHSTPKSLLPGKHGRTGAAGASESVSVGIPELRRRWPTIRPLLRIGRVYASWPAARRRINRPSGCRANGLAASAGGSRAGQARLYLALATPRPSTHLPAYLVSKQQAPLGPETYLAGGSNTNNGA